jgi:N-acetylmuramoyl-L-alanine amidase
MPSVLIELGFITNPTEEKYLVSSEGQDYLASAIYRAFRDYKHIIDSRSGGAAKNSVKNEPAPAIIKNDALANSNDLVLAGSAGAAATTQTAKNGAKPAEGTIFMVQIAALPSGTETKKPEFKDIESVTRLIDGERIKFGAGKFTEYEKALDYRRSITSSYPDAFVIAVKNGKIIPLKEAIEATENKKQ